MGNRDFKPTHFQVALKGLEIFIAEKHRVDPHTFYSLAIYGEETTVLSALSKDSQAFLDRITSRKFLKTHPPAGSSENLLFSLQFAVDLLGKNLQNIGGQTSRILIISDGFTLQNNPTELEALLQKSRGLNIAIDIILFSILIQQAENLPYSRLLNSRGVFQHSSTKKEFLQGMKAYAHETFSLKPHFDLPDPKDRLKEKLLVEMAQNLRRPTPKELLELKRQNSTIKCQICSSPKSPQNNMLFRVTGRFCPHCNTAFHLHCAGLWALKTKEAASNLFRCPFCYTLLKLPIELIAGLQTQKKVEKTDSPDSQPMVVKMIRVKDVDEVVDHECSFCFQELNSVESVKKHFRCSACMAYYHQDCLERMYKKEPVCPNCRGKII
jgi:hypothetical protein